MLIKVLSLGIGLAIGIILIAKVCFELSYDHCFNDVQNIYRIKTGLERKGDDFKDFGQVSGAIAPGFKQYIPEVTEATRITALFDSDKFYDEQSNVVSGTFIIADSSFFKVFDRPFLAGNWHEALCGWTTNVVVSRSFADKIGGPEEAIGKSIANEQVRKTPFTIVGVFEDFPDNSSFKGNDVIGSLDLIGKRSTDNWLGNDRYIAFVKLVPGTDPDSLKPAIRTMQEANQPLEELEKNGTVIYYFLDSFADGHIRESEVRSQILILSVVAFLLIFISVLNYVLIAISEVVKRSREVAVRKCYGATQANIYGLLVRTTAVNLGLSLLVAAVLIFACRGLVGQLTGVALSSLLIPQTLLVLIVVILLVFLASALIPARLFAKLPISSAFRGYKESKRRWKLSLLSFQFAINAMLLVLVGVVGAQYRKAMTEDVGYEYANLVYSKIPGVSQTAMRGMVEKLKQYPEVIGAELTYVLPFDESSGNNIYLPGDDRELFNIADQYGASEGFFSLMGFHLTEGKAPKGPRDIAVSESFVDKMSQFADWSDGAVGKSFLVSEHSQGDDGTFTVCGVYKDYRIHSAEDPDTRPSVRFCWDDESLRDDWGSTMNTLVVKLANLSPANIRLVEETVKGFAPDCTVEVTAYSSTVQKLYDGTRKMRSTFLIGAIFAMLIALIGLVGYLWDESVRRSGEIAVRKVNGAQSAEIVAMLVADILKLGLVAIVIGDICAWFVAHKWLEQFADKVGLSPLFFIAGDLVLLLVIVIVVAFNSLKISRTNPVDSLKNS